MTFKNVVNKNVLMVGDINFAITQIDLKERMNLDVFASVDRAFHLVMSLNIGHIFV